jgi:hypothetical protein
VVPGSGTGTRKRAGGWGTRRGCWTALEPKGSRRCPGTTRGPGRVRRDMRLSRRTERRMSRNCQQNCVRLTEYMECNVCCEGRGGP